jgi:hypothetical protein
MQSETSCARLRETFGSIQPTSGVLLQHSKWDGLLIALSVVHGAVLLAVPSIPLVAIGLWWNANTVSHYFIHLPFFRRGGWNRVYALYLSALLGFPHSLWRQRHLAHHFGRPGRPLKVHLTRNLLFETFLVLSIWGILLSRCSVLSYGLPAWLRCGSRALLRPWLLRTRSRDKEQLRHAVQRSIL